MVNKFNRWFRRPGRVGRVVRRSVARRSFRGRFEQNQAVVHCSMLLMKGIGSDSFTAPVATRRPAVRPGCGPRRPNAARALCEESVLVDRPAALPARPFFSSGPCAKPPGWSAERLATQSLGRSHRSALGKARLQEAIERTHALLRLPADYRLGIVPASDTGAVEMVLWSLLGTRGVDLLSWESFGEGWVSDVTKQLKLPDVRHLHAPYGSLPDLEAVDPDHDTVFVWNGTTAGVRVPNGDWIASDRNGLTICDATSAAFAMRLPWDRLDVVTWSWQKALGGEAAHGMLALSPRAVERLESYIPPWPLPKLFRLTSKGKLNEGVFRGETINTPSMLCVEDAID